MRSNTLLFLSGLAALTLGCGGGGGQALTKANTNTVMQEISKSVFNVLPQGSTVPTSPVPGLSTSTNLMTSNTSCETITPVPLVDADSDGIAEKKVYSYDCENSGTGTKTTQKGTATIVDKDESQAGLFGGIRIDYAVTKYRSETAEGNVTDQSFIGFWDYTASGGSLTSTSEFTGTYSFSSPTSTHVNDYTFIYSWTYKMTPTDSNNPFSAGSIELEGSYTFDGKFVAEENGVHSQGNGKWVMSYKSSDLKYDSSCSKFYRSGTMVMEDGNGGTFEFRYSCDSAKLFVNGTESTLYTP